MESHDSDTQNIVVFMGFCQYGLKKYLFMI